MCLGKCLQTEVIQQFCFLLAVFSDLTLWNNGTELSNCPSANGTAKLQEGTIRLHEEKALCEDEYCDNDLQ